MSLVHKIPPLVSALAFGYGIGMAAPETTIASVRTAVGSVSEDRPRALPPPRAAEPAPPIRKASAYGARDESPALGRLREAEAREAPRGEACALDRPLASLPQRYESRPDREVDDAEDLDTASSDALARLQLPDMNIPVTRRTLKYVRFFTREDRGRAMFETWLKRSGRYQELIEAELRERSLPEDLIWVAMIESGFDPRARSPAGAMGLWQFMPTTGAVYGLAQSRFLDQRKNPALATRAAAHHLRDLYLRFGAWDLALAAYNMGYEQLLEAVDRYGTTDFNELSRQEAIPRETAAYVPKIMAAAIVANNLERFGFDKVELARPDSVGEIAVPSGTKLKLVARAAGVATKELRALNPDLLAERVPPGRGDFVLLVPADTVARARAALPAMLEDEPLADEAAALAPVDAFTGRDLRRRRSEREDESLLALLPHPRRGAGLRDLGDAVGRAGEDLDDDSVDDDGLLDGRRARLLGGGEAERGEGAPRRLLHRRGAKARQTLMYRVVSGDTLLGVARQFAVDPEDVRRQNHLADGEALKVGALLKLRVRHDVLDDLGGADDKADKAEGKADSAERRDKAEAEHRPPPEALEASADRDDRDRRAAAPSKPASRHGAPRKARRDARGGG